MSGSDKPTIRVNHSGKRFGKLTISERWTKNSAGNTLWLAKCDCGREIWASIGNLNSGRSQSCGCLESSRKGRNEEKKKRCIPTAARGVPGIGFSNDLGGLRFGRLQVTLLYERGTEESPGLKWLCRCDCGREKWIWSNMLTSGRTRSCGCLRKESVARNMRKSTCRAPLKLDAGFASRRDLFRSYKSQAKKRGYEWDISFEYFCQIVVSNCRYCGAPPAQKHHGKKEFNGHCVYNGIDRIDNNIGYTEANVGPCCGCCNRMKWTMSEGEFLNLCREIAKNWPVREPAFEKTEECEQLMMGDW